jgi:hypothetical protein
VRPLRVRSGRPFHFNIPVSGAPSSRAALITLANITGVPRRGNNDPRSERGSKKTPGLSPYPKRTRDSGQVYVFLTAPCGAVGLGRQPLDNGFKSTNQ